MIHHINSSPWRSLRVFPRFVQSATPTDRNVRIGGPTLWDAASPPDLVRISVVFEWDKSAAERIAEEWDLLGTCVLIGGPAYGDPGHDFWPGQYLRQGYTITSRGCPGRCWFCSAWKREGKIRELPIMPGFNVLDNNLLACSEGHIRDVFDMLATQSTRPRFTGGIEAAALQDWHVDAFVRLKPTVIWFAYDRVSDYVFLLMASRKLKAAGLMTGKHRCCCYVLAGYNRENHVDTIEDAQLRVRAAVELGFFPQVMLLDDGRDWPDKERRVWKEWSWGWTQKKSVGSRMRKLLQKGS